jgi:hypothetical protein
LPRWGERDGTPTSGSSVSRLLSVIAEPAFFVRKVGTKVIDCVTGVLDGDGEFASDGHLVRLPLS